MNIRLTPLVFLCFFLPSLISCGSGGGEDDTQSTASSTTTCGDISINACNADSHDSGENNIDEASSSDGSSLGNDLQDGALRTAPAVVQKTAELEAQGQHVFRVWRVSAKDCNVSIGVCGGTVVNDNDTTTVSTTNTSTSTGDGNASVEQN